MQKQVVESFWRGIDLILPPRCVITGDMVENQGMISAKAWAGLDFIGTPQCKVCGIPFEYTLEEGMVCTDCLDYPPKFTSARAALKYNDSSRNLLLGFKHGDKTHAVLAFVPWLRRAGAEMLTDGDFLIPVPLHSRRLLARRYNQAALMAFALAREVGVPCLPMALCRVRATQTQGHLSTEERHKNVRKAFDMPLRFREKVKGKKIILMDDVYTTGATAKECTKVLFRFGAREVHILTLARVIH